MSTISLLRSIENNQDEYRGKGYIKIFCESLRDHAIQIINLKMKKMKLLTEEQKKSD